MPKHATEHSFAHPTVCMQQNKFMHVPSGIFSAAVIRFCFEQTNFILFVGTERSKVELGWGGGGGGGAPPKMCRIGRGPVKWTDWINLSLLKRLLPAFGIVIIRVLSRNGSNWWRDASWWILFFPPSHPSGHICFLDLLDAVVVPLFPYHVFAITIGMFPKPALLSCFWGKCERRVELLALSCARKGTHLSRAASNANPGHSQTHSHSATHQTLKVALSYFVFLIHLLRLRLLMTLWCYNTFCIFKTLEKNLQGGGGGKQALSFCSRDGAPSGHPPPPQLMANPCNSLVQRVNIRACFCTVLSAK